MGTTVGAQKLNVFGIWMIKCVLISNGVLFWNGLDKMAATLSGSDFDWFGFVMVGVVRTMPKPNHSKSEH